MSMLADWKHGITGLRFRDVPAHGSCLVNSIQPEAFQCTLRDTQAFMFCI